MRKFTKICLAASFILILVGGTICAIGAATGGWRLARDYGRDSKWTRFVWSVPEHFRWSFWKWEDWDEFTELDDLDDIVEDAVENAVTDVDVDEIVDEALEDAGLHNAHGDAGPVSHGVPSSYVQEQMPSGYSNTDVAAEDIHKLKIDIGGAALYIGESEDGYFGVKIDGKGNYRYYGKNGTFYLEGNRDSSWKDWNINGKKVYLYIPKGMNFTEADIELGAGLISMDALYADEMKLMVGAGQIVAEEIVCRELEAETGAGEMILNRVTTEEMEIINSAGHTYVNGSVSRKADVECSLGQTELALEGNEQDFNYELDCSVGSIKLGSRSYSALADDTKINNGAAKQCELECSMGEIVVSFSG